MYVATSDEKFKYHEHNKRENGNTRGDGQVCQRERLLFPAQLHVQYTWTGQLCVKLCVKEKDKKEITLKIGMKSYKYMRRVESERCFGGFTVFKLSRDKTSTPFAFSDLSIWTTPCMCFLYKFEECKMSERGCNWSCSFAPSDVTCEPSSAFLVLPWK